MGDLIYVYVFSSPFSYPVSQTSLLFSLHMVQFANQQLVNDYQKLHASIRAGRYWSFASRYIVQKYITILLFIAVIKDDCYIRVADCFIRVSRS